MLNKLNYFWQLSYQRSPQQNFNALRRKLEAHFTKKEPFEAETDTRLDETNTVIPDLWKQPIYQELIAYKFRSFNKPVVLLGELDKINSLAQSLQQKAITASTLNWNWEIEINLNSFSPEAQLIICHTPVSEYHWKVIHSMREKYLERVSSLYELVLPFTMIPRAQSSLNYYLKSLEEISPYYLGESYFGPLEKLNDVFPLAGKRVIEYGPFDGCQSAGLVNLGVKSLTCIEARAENAIKTMVARFVFGWNNVELIMDDFHNVNSLKYGTYDLAFSHGVYYHSIAPFLFLENFRSLSENIFIGGFCATDSLPEGNYELLEYCGKQYRVKMYQESNYFMSGVNQIAYFFHKEDLISFFRERNYEIIIISDEDADTPAGNYLRFLACKR